MCYIFTLIADDGEEGAVWCNANIPLFFRLNTKTDSITTDSVFWKYTESRKGMDELYNELSSVFMRWSTTEELIYRVNVGL